MLRTKVIFYDYYLLNTSKQVISLIKQYIGKTKEFNCIFNKIAVYLHYFENNNHVYVH